MSGLSLSTGAGVRAGGSYTPMTPASSTSASAGTIGQRAYGISGTGVSNQSMVAGAGSVCVGAIALGALIYLWSLPR